jgi:tetratricopeptide (TPR) repeat protein
MEEVKEIYFAGYSAFEKGNFQEAAKIANKCLDMADAESYWQFGTLGLCCWLSNFINDHAGVERYAHTLIEADSGKQKAWFDAVAWFNLGLAYKREKRPDEATVAFNNASQCYKTFLKQHDQSAEWAYIIRLFSSVAEFASSGKTQSFSELLYELLHSESKTEALSHIRKAVKLYLRFAGGEDVMVEAAKAVHQGVSRTFLAYILLAAHE